MIHSVDIRIAIFRIGELQRYRHLANRIRKLQKKTELNETVSSVSVLDVVYVKLVLVHVGGLEIVTGAHHVVSIELKVVVTGLQVKAKSTGAHTDAFGPR